MPESIAAVGAYFAAGSAAEVGTVAVADAAFGELAGGISLTAAEAAAGGASAAGYGAGAAAGGGLAAAATKAAVGGVASAGASALLTPKPPKVPGALAMPDAQAQEEARKRSIAEQMARRGRASTVLTAPAAGTLGG